MEADRDGSSADCFEYIDCDWGDLIYGSKEQLQALGIGVGLPFPGELGKRPRKMCVSDPRGFKTEIDLATHRGDRLFSASIHFPGRHEHPGRRRPELHVHAPGVTKCAWSVGCDCYIGTPEALVAVGLARIDQFPGQPGMRKTRVTIFPDGTVSNGAPTAAKPREGRLPGSKSIERATKTTYRICVVIAADQQAIRLQAAVDANREWEHRMRVLPRPARLRLPAVRTHARTLPAAWRVVCNAAPIPSGGAATPSLSLVK